MASAGRYEIVDTIASGDFATVCRGRDRELGREVAIKQIHQQFKPIIIHVTHDLDEALYFSNTIGIIKNNTIQYLLNTEQIKRLPLQDFIDQYL